ncbi:hemoglobin/transferrin/lactoferrin receptor protein [Spirosomataceae bacterium TFI 002]|nr:hemoglobin/transferrin/lactoferrin receptor protein [Spirosomataceae bacterium TFI 002]
MRLLLSFLVFTILNSSAIYAQIDSTISLEDIVVSGSRFEQLKKESPQEITIIGKKQISFQNTGNSASLLEQSGEVFVQKSQAGGGSPVLRGFEANKVLVVVDGVRMNNAIFRGGHLQNVLRIDQNILERVEVVIGPSSVNFGSDALGGVLHFRTKEAQFEEFNANAFVRYGSVNNEKTAHFDLNYGLENIAFLSSVSVSQFGDLMMGKNFKKGFEGFGLKENYMKYQGGVDVVLPNPDPYLQSPSGYNQYDFLQKVKLQTGSISHRLNLQVSMSSSVPRYDRLTDKNATGNLRFSEWLYGPEVRLLGSYSIDLPRTKLYDKASVIGSIQYFAESRISRKAFNYIRTTQNEDVNVLGLNADFQKHLKRHSIQYGIELLENNVSSHAFTNNIQDAMSAEIPAQTRYPDGGSKTSAYSVYLNDHIKLNPKVLWNGGVRFNYADLNATFKNKDFFPYEGNNAEQKNTAFSGNMGLIYLPSNSTRLKTLVSSGFRTPNIDDLAKVFDSAAGTLIVPNPNLNPEYTYNIEFGLKHEFARKLSLEGVYFYTFLRNAIVVSDFTINGSGTFIFQGVESRVVAMQNQARATVHGWNVKLDYKFNKELNLSSTLSKTIGKLDDGTPLDHIPPMYGKTSLHFQENKFEMELFAMYNGWKRLEDYSPNGEDNVQYATVDGSPSWWTLNTRTSYSISKDWTLQFSLENILDKNYRNFASGISAPGRNFLFTIRKKF